MRRGYMRWEWRIVLCVVLVSGLLVSGCEGTGEPDASGGTDGAGEGNPEYPQPYLTALPGPGGPVGTVLETINAGMYTYARIGTENAEIWAAAPMSELAVGDTVSLAGADNMGPFTSPTLDRTFEEIYFMDQFRTAGAMVDMFQGTVTEVMNAAGYTYALVNVGEEFRWMAASDTEEPVVWLAGPETVLSIGDVVNWQGGSVMRQFHSGTLNRTFTEIVFVSSLTRVQ